MKYVLKSIVASIVILLSSCSTAQLVKKQGITIRFDLTCSAIPEHNFSDLTHGLRFYTTSNINAQNILDVSEANKSVRSLVENSTITIDPTVNEFVNNSLSLYARSMGINVGSDVNNDYSLRINVKRFNVSYRNDNSSATIVELDYTLSNPDNETLIRQTARGRYVTSDPTMPDAKKLDKAYSEAIKSIDWVNIAGYLKAHKRAEQEPTRKVTGDGNTALEHTIIRWNVESRPAGADVSWRVVSSTPDVKNTNAAYLGTTPYESTESFDIRGLTFENSGNIQIEIKCEKPGYLPQTRRFNLRQAIEQKEISTKFNLVKDED